MSVFELYVRTEKEAESYRAHLRTIKEGLEKDAVVRITPDTNLRLPAIRTSYNLYEGEVSVAKLLTQIAAD